MHEKFFLKCYDYSNVRKDTHTSLHSIVFQYKPVPPEEKAKRGELFLQASLVQERRDVKGGIKTKTTPLGKIDVDNIDSVEGRQSFYAATDEAFAHLKLEHETREQIMAELALVVRLPGESSPKRPRIGLGTLFSNDQ